MAKGDGKRKGVGSTEDVWPVKTRNKIFLPFFPWKGSSEWKLGPVLGAGRFGSVHAGSLADRPVAVKVANKAKMLSEPGLADQLRQERRIHSVCSHHDHVLTLVDAWQGELNLMMAFDLCPDGSLFRLWAARTTPFPAKAVSLAAAQLGSALDYVHTVGIVHRDVKLENVLVSGAGGLLLTDFGLAAWLGRRDRAREICGTLAYMAPEVLGGGPYGHAADWWSLGVTLFAMSRRRHPFTKGPDHEAMLENVLSEHGTVAGELRPAAGDLDDALCRLLVLDQAERCSRFEEIRGLLEERRSSSSFKDLLD